MIMLGYLIPYIAEALSDDDDESYYDLPEYVRRSNICIRAGKQWVTIPLPIEYRALYGLGELSYGVTSRNEVYTNAELSRQIMAQMSQVFPIDILEGGGGYHAFIPSSIKPVVEPYMMNEGWTGLPISKSTPYNENDPEWTKSYSNVDKDLVSFSRWLNELSGGDDYKKGWADFNPGKLEYMINGIFGGVTTFPNKLKKGAETAFGAREFEWRNMPIASRVIKSGDERTAQRRLTNDYFRIREEYEQTKGLLKNYQKEADEGSEQYKLKLEELEQSPAGLRYEIFEWYRSDLDRLYSEISEMPAGEERESLERERQAMLSELVEGVRDPSKFFQRLYENGEITISYATFLREHLGITIE